MSQQQTTGGCKNGKLHQIIVTGLLFPGRAGDQVLCIGCKKIITLEEGKKYLRSIGCED